MTSGIIAIAAALAISVSTMGPAIGQAEAAGEIRSTLILSLGLMEALTIYGLLIAFMLVAKV